VGHRYCYMCIHAYIHTYTHTYTQMQTVAIRGECDVCGQAVTVAQKRLVTQDGRYRHMDCNKVSCRVCV
jgi:hypothetical protein